MRDLVITTRMQPKHIIDIKDDDAANQLAAIIFKDKDTRHMVLKAFDIFTGTYFPATTARHLTSDN